MLEAREISFPAWFAVFVVLPLVIYFLLGKCGESAKKNGRLSLIAEGAAEEALRVDSSMAVDRIMPVVHLPNGGIRRCARCFELAKTRCSQCKSVWYCSGKCQIIHWRQVHKFECVQLGRDCGMSSLTPILSEVSCGRLSFTETAEQYSFKQNELPSIDCAPSDDAISPPINITSAATVGTTLSSQKSVVHQRSMNSLFKGNRHCSGTTNDAALNTSEEASRIHSSFSQSSENTHLEHHANIPSASYNHDVDLRSALHESSGIDRTHLNLSGSENHNGNQSASTASIGHANTHAIQLDPPEEEYMLQNGIPSNYESKGLNCSTERASVKKANKSRIILNTLGSEMHKSTRSRGVPRESQSSDKNLNIQNGNQSRVAGMKESIPLQESNSLANLGMMKTIGTKKLEKTEHKKHAIDTANRHKRIKMIFPYEEFVKYFKFEVFNLTPRGLVNCGNSCYANAVLQCLTSTKPLTIYLLHQTHSRGCAKDWCLMCELEQLVTTLKDCKGPLSPINILMYIRSLNSQIGDGSQEDAHEFLRLLVASMQSICLDSYGGENVVHSRLQDTTFIQHMFGGYLRSKVTCLRCYHESERYENMMDLTLEIYGWIESLEDALTQFTSSEDLDGENMYRCPRCVSYVRARKQLSIQEAPNILTIVLKRFQEGSYGKINKCITFPEMLDMVPFMTGTDDIPPLYMLYAVVVHLDTSNASFSGHYISFVKDMQGNWLRVDDTEVQPAKLSQVMLEGAYILFYMRSQPRSAGVNMRASRHRNPSLPKQSPSKTQSSSRPEKTKANHNFDRTDISGRVQIRENKSKPSSLENYVEFSDVSSSGRSSLFTSSDDSSFTTESTRDSFSNIEHADVVSLQSANSRSQSTISCRMFGRSKPQTRFA